MIDRTQTNEQRRGALDMLPGYAGNMDHIADELRRFDSILERAVARFRAARGRDVNEEFRGLYISEEEIDDVMTPSGGGDGRDEEIHDMRERGAVIRERVRKSCREGVLLRLPRVASIFGLSDFETDILLLAFAPELNRGYRKIYAYLQDDVTKKKPSVDLALQLFCGSLDERVAGRRAFSDDAPLIAWSIIHLHDDPSEKPSLIDRIITLDKRIAQYLLGDDRPVRRFSEHCGAMRRIEPQIALDDLVLSDRTRAAAEKLVDFFSEAGQRTCSLHGPDGAGKKSIAEAVCKGIDRSLLVLDTPNAANAEAVRSFLREGFREAGLYGSVVYIDRRQEPPAGEQASAFPPSFIEEEVRRFPGPVFYGGTAPWRPRDTAERPHVIFEVPRPDEESRKLLWKKSLQTRGWSAGAIDCGHIAAAFRFTPGQIQRAIALAENQARLRERPDVRLSTEDLLSGCREESEEHLVSFARRITPRRSWDDLVLPGDTLSQLKEFCQQVRCRGKVYDTWGFGGRLSLGKGSLALFTGPSGTGKTLTAEILANSLGTALYKVDLSCVVSKYIGETEKNLGRVFRDAQDGNAVLFFDEADALFGKRTEVKDAHDRYANIEINYLLQRVEEYDGVIILSSNMSNNIDGAFLRRMQASVDFPFPDESSRLRIWRAIFPPQTPLSGDVDFAFLACKFKIAGGNIKNVALSAAFRAADGDGPVTMEHLMLSMKREYRKLDKVCEKSEFEKYYGLVR